MSDCLVHITVMGREFVVAAYILETFWDQHTEMSDGRGVLGSLLCYVFAGA